MLVVVGVQAIEGGVEAPEVMVVGWEGGVLPPTAGWTGVISSPPLPPSR